MERGQKVRFVGGPYGVVAHFDATRFERETVKDGDTGTYAGPHPHPRMDGWYLIAVTFDNRQLYVPVGAGAFEAADA